MPEPALRPLMASELAVGALAALLIETVAHGGSVGFMHPLAPSKAEAFWRAALADPGRRVLGAWLKAGAGDVLAGTVTLIFGLPENQPHRAEIAKMMVAPAHRGQGIGTLLLAAAETEARAQGRSHLLLDTASEEGAAGFYERAGFSFVGEVPDYALKPHGGLTGTRLYWKRLA